jgi:hypothetical protein
MGGLANSAGARVGFTEEALSGTFWTRKRVGVHMSKAIRWVNDHLGANGLYRPFAARVLLLIERYFSLNNCLNKRAARLLNCDVAPPWVSEVYQLLSLSISVLLIALAYLSVAAEFSVAKVLVALASLYRPVEIFIFTINWMLMHQGPVQSFRRSLLGFLINLAEITLFFAAAELSAGCIRGSLDSSGGGHVILSAIYSSLRTVVTIGPTPGVCNDGSCMQCMAILALQIIVGFPVIVGAIANVVGGMERGQVDKQWPN